ncbi:MAG: hypothetical protein JXB10_03460 [Pirellulales bacterium]|nr:hypothetical protein [Pirellulales bacterium]
MKLRSIWVLGFFTAVSCLLILGGCTSSEPPVLNYAPTVDPAEAGKAALKQYDQNKDGKLDAAELEKAPAMKLALPRLDKNGDKALSAEEIAERVKRWQTKEPGRRLLRITITHNGEPLEGAEVKLVPEKFIGADMEAAVGKTSPSGTVSPSGKMGPDGLAGCSPGFYRVVITKAGESIPARYNTQTVLGLDSSEDSDELYRGVRFDLQY